MGQNIEENTSVMRFVLVTAQGHKGVLREGGRQGRGKRGNMWWVLGGWEAGKNREGQMLGVKKMETKN